MRPRRQGGPRLGCEDSRTGHLGIGPARHGAVVAPPGHDHVNRQGLPSPLSRRHAHLCQRPPVRAHPEQACPVPPTARPRPHGARPWNIRHRSTGPPSPRQRCLALGWTGRLRRDRADRHGRPCAARPPGPLDGHGRGRSRVGDRSGRPLRRASACAGAGPHGVRRRPLGPSIPRRGTWRAAPLTRGAHATRGPVVWLPAPRVHPPVLAIAVAIGPMHHHGRRTGRCDRTGALIPCQPAVTRWLRKRCALTRLGHGRCRPLPDLPPHHPAMDALERHSHRGMAPRRCTRVALYGAHPGLRLGRAVMQTRRVLPQPHDRLRAEARQGAWVWPDHISWPAMSG
jgi:hypothetical protein